MFEKKQLGHVPSIAKHMFLDMPNRNLATLRASQCTATDGCSQLQGNPKKPAFHRHPSRRNIHSHPYPLDIKKYQTLAMVETKANYRYSMYWEIVMHPFS